MSSGDDRNASKAKRNKMRKNQQMEDDEEEWTIIGDRRGGGSRGSRGRNHGSQPVPGTSAISNFAMGAVGLGIAALGLSAAAVYKAYFSKDDGEEKSYTPTTEDCVKRILHMKSDIEEYPVLGFDCQRNLTDPSQSRSRVSILQLCTYKGKTLLVPLNKIYSIPEELKSILRNEEIIKTGVDVLKNANFLKEDFDLEVNSTFDLKFLAQDTGNRPAPLKTLAANILDWDVNCEALASDWEAGTLSEKQIKYAKTSVEAAIEIFKTLYKYTRLVEEKAQIMEYCRPNLSKSFV